jgi:hypothetical protein
MNGDLPTTRTYTDAKIEERGKEVTMEAAAALLTAIRATTQNPERISALADAVHAGTSMMDVCGSGEDVP